MKNLIIEVKTFTDGQHQPSAWSDKNTRRGKKSGIKINEWTIVKYIIQLENFDIPIYFSKWEGDPGRTFDIKSARQFLTKKEAEKKIGDLREKHELPFINAEVLEAIWY